MTRTCFLWLLTLAAPATPAAEPDFSGQWLLNEQQSGYHRFRGAVPKTMLIRHEGDEIEVTTPAQTEGADAAWRHKINGRETKHQVGGEEHRCVLKWEGDALLTNTLVSGARGQYTLMDRWKLSADRKTLQFRRQMVTIRGEAEAALVYERDQTVNQNQ